ncbi:hypothetical protein [Actinomadura harenae]|uniref:Uncharacterized protein n=1 Tax=Actinomadura harenae TaxID=2483351 RepID=A0A3M2LT72_9ACTN|nr:hypothetical protein [Actinomadura harenae]RMI40432.1 hypothetical protein EBO15_26605 [Actinomadura harenae]
MLTGILVMAYLVVVVVWADQASPSLVAWVSRAVPRWTGGSVAGAAVFAATVQLGGMLLSIACWAGAITTGESTGERWLAALWGIPMILVSAPLAYGFVPARTQPPYKRIRGALVRRGATARQARAAAWAAGPLACFAAGAAFIPLPLLMLSE